MSRPLHRLSLALLALALLASACGSDGGSGDARKGGSISVALSSAPDYLDPARATTIEAATALWLVYPGLVTYRHAEGKEGTELIPAAAEALPKASADGKTYTATLRAGLRYSDGSPVKASDFEHAVKRALILQWAGSNFLSGIAGADDFAKAGKPDADLPGIEADDRTRKITIRLNEPDGRFLYSLTFPATGMVPAATPFKDQGSKPPPGLGAYRFAEVRPNRGFTLERVRDFDLPDVPKGNVDRIAVNVVRSPARQTQDVIRGRLDYMLDEPAPDLIGEVRERHRDRYEEHAGNSTYFFFLNTQAAPFDKAEVRRAANLAIDRRAIVRLFGGLLEPGCNFLPPAMPGYEEQDCPEGADVARARELVRQAGAQGAKVKVWGNDEERSRKVATYFAEALNGIGLDAKPEILSGDSYFAAVDNPKTKAQTGYDNVLPAFPHPGDVFSLVDGSAIDPAGTMNHSLVDDPAVNKAIEAINAAPAQEVADEAAELDRLITSPEKSYLAPYGHGKTTTFVSERMDFENCTVQHPVYLDDWSQFCLK